MISQPETKMTQSTNIDSYLTTNDQQIKKICQESFETHSENVLSLSKTKLRSTNPDGYWVGNWLFAYSEKDDLEAREEFIRAIRTMGYTFGYEMVDRIFRRDIFGEETSKKMAQLGLETCSEMFFGASLNYLVKECQLDLDSMESVAFKEGFNEMFGTLFEPYTSE